MHQTTVHDGYGTFQLWQGADDRKALLSISIGEEMIAIVNITQPCESVKEHTYSLRINRREICQFDHRRENGLAACLLAAAKAVEKQKWMETAQFLDAIQSRG